MYIKRKVFLVLCCLGTALINAGYSQTQNSVAFRKIVLTTDFISEGVAVGDVNHDGKTDILAGSYWFDGRDWKKHEIDTGRVYFQDKEYSHSFLNYSMDVNMDGWTDQVVIDFPGTTAIWYENPKNNKGYWTKHLIFETVGNESPAFVDVDGDGRTDLLCADTKEKQMIWLQAPLNKESTSWTKFTISEKNAPATDIFSHGLGLGDLNKDGRPDIIITAGWWEGPDDPKNPGWVFHPADLGDECSQMYVMDVNNDGLIDVISGSAHLCGVWWHEQMKDSTGNTIWQSHAISFAFSESHALALADINGDGHADIVTGKRNLRRNTWRNNPGTHGPPLLYWYEFTPGQEPYWVPHLIDDASGAGLNLVAQDISGDGKTDIVIANFKGVFIFKKR